MSGCRRRFPSFADAAEFGILGLDPEVHGHVGGVGGVGLRPESGHAVAAEADAEAREQHRVVRTSRLRSGRAAPSLRGKDAPGPCTSEWKWGSIRASSKSGSQERSAKCATPSPHPVGRNLFLRDLTACNGLDFGARTQGIPQQGAGWLFRRRARPESGCSRSRHFFLLPKHASQHSDLTLNA